MWDANILYMLLLGAKDATEAKIAPFVMLHCGISGPHSGAWNNANVKAGLGRWEKVERDICLCTS